MAEVGSDHAVEGDGDDLLVERRLHSAIEAVCSRTQGVFLDQPGVETEVGLEQRGADDAYRVVVG